MSLANGSTMVLRCMWVLPMMPLAGAVASALMTDRRGRRTGRWFAFLLSTLATVGWALAALALFGAPEANREYVLRLPLIWRLEGLTLFLSCRLDVVSGVLGLGVAAASLLLQSFGLEGDGDSALALSTPVAHAAGWAFLLAGDYFSLFVAWIALSWTSYLALDGDADGWNPVVVLGTLSDGALGFAVLQVATICGSTDIAVVSNWAANRSGKGNPVADVVAGALLFAVGARVIQVAVAGNGDRRASLAARAQMSGMTLLPGVLYLLLRAQGLLLKAPFVLSGAYWLGVVGVVVFPLLMVFQRGLGRAVLFGVLAEGSLSVAALRLGTPTVLAYRVGLQGLVATGLFLCIGIIRLLAREAGGTWDLSKSHHRDLPFALSAFVLVALTQSGLPPLAGHRAKGALLAHSYHTGHWALCAVGIMSIALMSFYVARMVLSAGRSAGFHGAADEAPSPPAHMWAPVALMVGLLAFAGFAAEDVQRWVALALSMRGAPECVSPGPTTPWLPWAQGFAVLAGALWAWRGHRRGARWRIRGTVFSDRRAPAARSPASLEQAGAWCSLRDDWSRARERLRGRLTVLPPEIVAALSLCALLLFLLLVR